MWLSSSITWTCHEALSGTTKDRGSLGLFEADVMVGISAMVTAESRLETVSRGAGGWGGGGTLGQIDWQRHCAFSPLLHGCREEPSSALFWIVLYGRISRIRPPMEALKPRLNCRKAAAGSLSAATIRNEWGPLCIEALCLNSCINATSLWRFFLLCRQSSPCIPSLAF